MAESLNEKLLIRSIEAKDNKQVQKLIVSVMSDYGCIGEGYSSSDPELVDMYQNYSKKNHAFYVIVDDQDRVLGCGGIAPLSPHDTETCELRKMYFYTELRGKGYGRKLIELLIQKAKDLGFQKCYLETVHRMKAASILYAKYGFEELSAPQGNTGHCGCDKHMLKILS